MKMKTVKIFGILISLLFLFASCGLLWNDGETEVTINLPYVTSANGRAIDSGKKDDLRNATKSYRVHMNDTVIEGTGGNFSAFFTVGIKLDIYVECLNSKREVIIRTNVKSIVVGSGQNIVDFNLMTDGNEIINTGVFYSYGDAELHGNKYGLPSSVAVEKGEVFTVDDGTNMAWQHATEVSGFAGWKTNVALTGDVDSGTQNAQADSIVQSGGKYIMPEGGVLLTAQWNKKTYTIRYDKNSDGSGGTESSTNIGDTQIDALEPYQVSSQVPDPVTVGSTTYTFAGWLGSDGTSYRSGQSIPRVTDNMTLYAQWSDKTMYRVTFTAPANKPAFYTAAMPSPQSVEENTAATWTNPAAAGWTFEGWEVSDTDTMQPITTLGPNITSYTPTTNVTLTAKWTQLIVISFNWNTDKAGGNDGSVTGDLPNDITVDPSVGSATIPFPTVSRPGYTFLGWSENQTNSSAQYTSTNNQMGGISSSKTLYAVWNTAIAYRELSEAVVGDVICANGKVLSASDITTELQSQTIAVVYKVEASSKKVWAISKNFEEQGIAWCSSSSVDGYFNAPSTLVTEMDDETNGQLVFKSGTYTDGSTGLEKLRSSVNDAASDDNLRDNYPAWWWCYNYGNNTANVPNNAASDLKTGWYLPTLSENFDIWKANDGSNAIDNALEKTGGNNRFETNIFWTSSLTDDTMNARKLMMGSVGGDAKDSGSVSVCAVRQFTY